MKMSTKRNARGPDRGDESWNVVDLPHKRPPLGMIDAAEDVMFDMENSPPDDDERVIEFDGKGNMRVYPASELPKEEQ